MKNLSLILLFSSIFILACEDFPPLKTSATLEIINETSCDFDINMFETSIGISANNSIDSIEIDLKGEFERNNTLFVVEPRDSCSYNSLGLYEFDLKNGVKYTMIID